MRRLLVAISISACATTSHDRPGSRGMRESDHLEAARTHADAAQRLRWPDRRPPADGSIAGSPDVAHTPWFYYWNPAIDHERLAQIHRAAAAQIEAEYGEACGEVPASEVSVSPIVRYAVGGAPTPDGVALYLSSEAGTPEHLLAAMRCHRAWMMLGHSMMEDCPLDLAGIQVVAHAVPEGIEVLLAVEDAALVPELQRRAAKDVEVAATRFAHHPR